MKKLNWKNCLAGLLLCVSGIPGSIHAQQIISTDFSSAELPPEMKLTAAADWQITDGVLRSKVLKKGMPSFGVSAKDWSSFDLEFKIRRLQLLEKDQHFGVIFKTDKEDIQLYCRGKNLILKVPSLKFHAQFGTVFEKELAAGADAPWATFSISLKDQLLTVKMDGKQIASMDKFPGPVKSLSLYAYRNQIELDDLRIVVYDSDVKKKVTSQLPQTSP